uniref:Mitochondrial pyruvate carrier n=1 Tax=Oryza meridionalis TaxID=40149 RepID=A0A0E0EKL1_9ORYZ
MGLEVNRGQSSLSIPNPNSQFPTPKSQPPIHRVVSPPTNKTARGAGGVPTPPSLRIPSSGLPNEGFVILGAVSREMVHLTCYLLTFVVAVHFWAPTFKWGISIANVADFAKPPEKISYPQQVAVACTGVIWSRYSMVITPKNWNLFSVNVAMAGTGLYQLSRKIRKDYFSDQKDDVASLEG